MPKALIFDVFGTLVDWRGSIARQLAPVFKARGLARDANDFAVAWRAEYEPAMAPVREGRRGYTALDILHRENLETVLSAHGIRAAFSEAEIHDLARAWERLDPWPEVLPAMTLLQDHFLLAPCSNGSIALMVHMARHAGFRWDAILGAEIAQNYKPDASVYLKSCAAIGLNPEQVMMVAAHNDDLKAASEAGLQTAFFPRAKEYAADQTRDLRPEGVYDFTAADLMDLARQLTET